MPSSDDCIDWVVWVDSGHWVNLGGFEAKFLVWSATSAKGEGLSARIGGSREPLSAEGDISRGGIIGVGGSSGVWRNTFLSI